MVCVCLSPGVGRTGGRSAKNSRETWNITKFLKHTCDESHAWIHTHTHSHTHTPTHACAWVFKMHLCTHGKQGHMHSGRYCYARIEIKLANAISFLPRAAGPICKHQTASLQKTCWISLFKASPHPPQNPNSIITPVFIQNAFSLTVANYILIHEAHFSEEIVWLAWDWHWVAAVQKGRETKVRADESCCLLFLSLPHRPFLCHADGN